RDSQHKSVSLTLAVTDQPVGGIDDAALFGDETRLVGAPCRLVRERRQKRHDTRRGERRCRTHWLLGHSGRCRRDEQPSCQHRRPELHRPAHWLLLPMLRTSEKVAIVRTPAKTRATAT